MVFSHCICASARRENQQIQRYPKLQAHALSLTHVNASIDIYQSCFLFVMAQGGVLDEPDSFCYETSPGGRRRKALGASPGIKYGIGGSPKVEPVGMAITELAYNEHYEVFR